MSSTCMYLSTDLILFVALNLVSAADKNAHNAISRDKFGQMKNVMKMLMEKVIVQEWYTSKKEFLALKNGYEGTKKRTGGNSESTTR